MKLKPIIGTSRKIEKKTNESRAYIKQPKKLEEEVRGVKTDSAEVEIEWYSKESKKSDCLENEFTNFVEDFITDHQVENAVNLLNNDLNRLKENIRDDIRFPENSKGERLKQIIEMYFALERPEYDYWFVKTDIKTDFQSSLDRAGSVRVVMVNAKNMETNKHFLQILFVDPYHLFIPGRHNGSSAEEMKKKTYEYYSKLDTCLSKHLK